jgi:hypothetical protein
MVDSRRCWITFSFLEQEQTCYRSLLSHLFKFDLINSVELDLHLHRILSPSLAAFQKLKDSFDLLELHLLQVSPVFCWN